MSLFIMYYVLALISALLLEIINYNKVSGLGLIVYILIMILFYLIRINSFCRNKEELK